MADEYASVGRSRFITICVVVIIVGMLGMFYFQLMDARRTYQADEASIHEREELRQRILSLEKSLAEDRTAYGNRGIIQKAVLKKAIERGWFTTEEVGLLMAVAEQANYPQNGK